MLTSSSSKKWSVEIHCALLARSSVCGYQSPMASVNVISKWRRFSLYMQSPSRGQSWGLSMMKIAAKYKANISWNDGRFYRAEERYRRCWSQIPRTLLEYYATFHLRTRIRQGINLSLFEIRFNRTQVFTSNLRQELFNISVVCTIHTHFE